MRSSDVPRVARDDVRGKRTRQQGHPSAACGRWNVIDRETGRPYLDMGFATEEEAWDFRRDLLLPYPFKHEWRRRIGVEAVR
jgi:hypothetical protein